MLCGEVQYQNDNLIQIMPCSIELEVDLKNVQNQLKGFPPKQWHALGILLNVPEDKLEEFEANYPRDVARCLTEVIKHWIRTGKAEWKVLWKALCDNSSTENLGKKIRNWYTEKSWNDPRVVSHCYTW